MSKWAIPAQHPKESKDESENHGDIATLTDHFDSKHEFQYWNDPIWIIRGTHFGTPPFKDEDAVTLPWGDPLVQ